MISNAIIYLANFNLIYLIFFYIKIAFKFNISGPKLQYFIYFILVTVNVSAPAYTSHLAASQGANNSMYPQFTSGFF